MDEQIRRLWKQLEMILDKAIKAEGQAAHEFYRCRAMQKLRQIHDCIKNYEEGLK